MHHWRTISLAKNPGTLVRFTFHKMCPRQELHLHCAGFEADVSAVGLRGHRSELLPAGFAPALGRV